MVIEATIPLVAAPPRRPLEPGTGTIAQARHRHPTCSSPFKLGKPELMPFRVLVVDHDSVSRAAMDRMLSAAGNMVTSVAEFAAAEERLVYAPPDLLVTSVKLGAHNGIHLVLRAQADHPHTQAIVTHTDDDPVLEEEATSAGATYVKVPVDEARFMALVDGW